MVLHPLQCLVESLTDDISGPFWEEDLIERIPSVARIWNHNLVKFRLKDFWLHIQIFSICFGLWCHHFCLNISHYMITACLLTGHIRLELKLNTSPLTRKISLLPFQLFPRSSDSHLSLHFLMTLNQWFTVNLVDIDNRRLTGSILREDSVSDPQSLGKEKD